MTVMNTDSDARHAAALPLDFEVMQIVCPINCNLYPKLRHASLLQIKHTNVVVIMRHEHVHDSCVEAQKAKRCTGRYGPPGVPYKCP